MIKIQKILQSQQSKIFSKIRLNTKSRFAFAVQKETDVNPKIFNIDESNLSNDPKNIGQQESINNYMVFPIKNVVFPYSSYFARISSSQYDLLTKLKVQYVAAFLTKKALEKANEFHQTVNTVELGATEEGSTVTPSTDGTVSNEEELATTESQAAIPEPEKKTKRIGNFPLNSKGSRSKKFRDALAANPEGLDDNDIHHIIVYDDNISMHYGQTIEIVDQDGRLKVVTDENLFNVTKLNSIEELRDLGVMCKLTLQTLPSESGDRKPENFAILKSLYRIKLIEEIINPIEVKELVSKNSLPGISSKGFKSKIFGNRSEFMKKFSGEDRDIQDNMDNEPSSKTIDDDIKTLMDQFKFVKIQHLYSAAHLSEKAITDAYRTKLSTLIGYYTKMRLKVQINVPELFIMPDDPRMLDIICGFLSATTFFNNKELQSLLETIPIKDRLDLSLKYFIRYEKNFLSKWDDLEKNSTLPLDQNSQKQQYVDMYNFLKRSSENPFKRPVVDKLKANMQGKKFPPEILKLINEDMSRFTEMQESHPDYNIYRSFLELITSLPFGIHSEDNFDINHAKQILDEDHYGLEDVKDRILEFIAVAKLKGNIKGKSLLLVGPPGVGKTSIGSSIARCLNRKFSRISLGGEYDVSILKGHRKTYLGAYPGKIIQALRTCDTENPVILLDEVDKISQGMKGNLQDALLEILDPVQNSKFTDHFLDTPIDLSNVLFICTANLQETIHPALLDRMEVIALSGYTKEEKKQILRKYLLPRALDHAGLKEKYSNAIEITDDAIERLLVFYSREAGVRNLERFIKRICEKLTLKLLTQKPDHIAITAQNLYEFVGLPLFSDQRLYENIPPPGVVIGLAYNSYGGSILFIESVKANYDIEPVPIVNKTEEKNDTATAISIRKGGIKITGSLGDVMQESIQIAYSYAKWILHSKFNNSYLEINDVHIHFPEGATKKDGPSAGIAITTSLISLAMNTTMSDVIGMTGELSLTGKVLKIGGVKEKILAAKRENIKHLILPIGNKQDVEDLKDYIKEGLVFNFVETYDDVLNIVFPGLISKYQKNIANEKEVKTNSI